MPQRPGHPEWGGRAADTLAVRSTRYARTSFLYATRCGWSASGPFRRFRFSMYDW